MSKKSKEQELKDKLWEHCKSFVAAQSIYSSESVYQSDRVIENAYEFIEGVCDIVGYHEVEEDE